MISDVFTQLPANKDVIEYIFAFDHALGGWMVFSILLALMVVYSSAIYYWKQDFTASHVYGNYMILFVAFLFTLVRSEYFVDASGDPLRLLSFAKFSFFLVILILATIYKVVSDQ